jgi:hypothetical protein
VFSTLASLVIAGLLYQFWTNPESVRRKVLASLQSTFLDVRASVESARLRLFGGIDVKEIRLSRKGNLDQGDFLYIPSATIYHDKEHVLEEGLHLRKVEIRRLSLHLVREQDGRWNVSDLFGPSDLSRALPSIIVRQGQIRFEDHQALPGTPPLDIQDVSLTVVNDPLPIVTFQGSGTCESLGTVKITGQVVRGGGAMTLSVEAPALKLGPEMVQRLAGYNPEAAAQLRQANARGTVSAQLTWDPRSSPALHYTVRGELTEGTVHHVLLPWALEHLHGSFECADGLMSGARFTAAAGATQVALQLHGVHLDSPSSTSWSDRITSADLQVRKLLVTADLFKYLPAGLQGYQQEYSPRGIANVDLHLKNLGPGLWLQNGTVTAEEMEGVYASFRYPLHKVKGSIDWKVTSKLAAPSSWSGMSDDWLSIDLNGEAGGQTVFLKGRSEGETGRAAVQFDIWGNNFPVDETLLAMLPQRSQLVARTFQPAGQLDFRVFLRRQRGEEEIARRFLLQLHDATICYSVFPLVLHEVSGTLDMRPDSWEFRDFVGKHNGGVIRASGHSLAVPAGPAVHTWTTVATTQVRPTPPESSGMEESEPGGLSSHVSVEIQGENLPIDSAFKTALAPGREALVKAFDTFALTGRLNFTAHIDDLPNQPRDIDVSVHVGGCRINPAFFPYAMEDVAATVRYAKKHVWVTGFQARHGQTTIHVNEASVFLPEEGGYWARLNRVDSPQLRLDDDLKRAMPAGLAKLVHMLQIDQPVNLSTLIVIKQLPLETARPTVYWDSLIRLSETTLRTGVELNKVSGVVSCEGVHNGQQLEDVVGNVFFQQATILRQPLQNVLVPLIIHKETPEILSMPDLKADLYGGIIGGEARLEFGSSFRYDLALNASHVQLEQLGSHNLGRGAELTGLANGAIHLAGQGEDPASLKGHGRIDVPSGKLARLPLLLDLLKWLGLRLPDRTAFEQAHADFRIEGPRMHITELDLYGNALSVRGQGSMKLDGTDLKLDMNADWGRLSQLLPPGINDLSRELSNQLLRVKVHGKVDDLKFEKELVPVVTEPIKRLWKSLSGARITSSKQ